MSLGYDKKITSQAQAGPARKAQWEQQTDFWGCHCPYRFRYSSYFLLRARILIFFTALNNLDQAHLKVCFSDWHISRKVLLNDFERAVSSVSLQVFSNTSECWLHAATREQQGAAGESQRRGEGVTVQKEICKPGLANTKHSEGE